MINSRDLDQLTPVVAALAQAFVAACAKAGVPVLITCTYRDDEYQNTLYAQGRTLPGKVVTRAKGGESMHCYRIAFDYVPLVNGKPEWSKDALWARTGFIGEQLGLTWGGRWSSIVDKPHMQFTQGKSIAQLKALRVLT